MSLQYWLGLFQIKGAAYDLFLSRTLKHASIVRFSSSEDAMGQFDALGLDAGAKLLGEYLEYARRSSLVADGLQCSGQGDVTVVL